MTFSLNGCTSNYNENTRRLTLTTGSMSRAVCEAELFKLSNSRNKTISGVDIQGRVRKNYFHTLFLEAAKCGQCPVQVVCHLNMIRYNLWGMHNRNSADFSKIIKHINFNFISKSEKCTIQLQMDGQPNGWTDYQTDLKQQNQIWNFLNQSTTSFLPEAKAHFHQNNNSKKKNVTTISCDILCSMLQQNYHIIWFLTWMSSMHDRTALSKPAELRLRQ